MSAAGIIQRAHDLGVSLRVDGDKIKLKGPGPAVEQLLPQVKAHKPELIAVMVADRKQPDDPEVHAVSDPAAQARRLEVLTMLAERPGIKYAVATHTDVDPDFVIVAVAIRGVAAFELRIPQKRYDGLLLLEILERHTLH